MKLYIVADMEGVAGVVSPSQTQGNSPDYEAARLQYTREVKSVCEAALDSGAEEIYVNDFHGNGLGIIPELMPQNVMLIRGDFRSKSGFDLLDGTFSGLIFIGAHARTGTLNGVIPHSYTPKVTFELFGQPLGEFDILSLLAGEQKVPTILISGDSTTIEQARTNLPSTHMVITKYSTGVASAMCIHPQLVCELLGEEIRRAIRNIAAIEPPEISPPVMLTVKVNEPILTDRIGWIPGMKLVSDTSFEFSGKSMKEVADLVYGVTILAEG